MKPSPLKMLKKLKKQVKKLPKHVHCFDIEQCDSCGHVLEYCLGCEKSRCTESPKLQKTF